MILGIAHIAIAVKDIQESLKLWRDDLGLTFLGTERVPAEGVETAFLASGKAQEHKIELLQAMGDESPIKKFVEKNGVGGIHHIALLVDDIEKEMQSLISKGYRCVHSKPRRGAHNSKVAFLHPKSCAGVLIELVQEALPE